MHLSLRVASIALLAGVSAGCPGPSTPTDAALVRPDGNGVDVGPIRGNAPTLAPCTEDFSCAEAPGVACLTNVPGGVCTRRCDLDAECGANGSCVQHVCLWSCYPGSGNCVEHAGACIQTQSGTAYCTPVCYPEGRLPAGYPSCGAGLVCDPYTSTCVAELGTGQVNGGPCRDGIDCRGGECQLETDFTTGGPSGFLDGMCLSYGIVPPDSAYVPGRPLPQGSCPDGSAVMPGYSFGFEGDLSTCYPTCVSDGDCRPGYGCTHTEGGAQYTTGLCMPIDCTIASCPSGTRCNTGASGWLGHAVCERLP